MPKSNDPKAVSLSVAVYERLLALYPRSHHGEFGPSMAQLFRDQCREAWAESRGRGLVVLWLRVSIDLATTAAAERARNLHQTRSALWQALRASRADPVMRKTFFALFLGVFALAVGSSAFMASTMPNVYAGRARISVNVAPGEGSDLGARAWQAMGRSNYFDAPLELQRMQSDRVLSGVARTLNLRESPAELRARILLLPVLHSSTMIEIWAYGESAEKAAGIANAIAEIYCEGPRLERSAAAGGAVPPAAKKAQLLDPAVTMSTPVQPNRPALLFFGLFGGFAAALAIGVFGAALVVLSRRLSRTAGAMA